MLKKIVKYGNSCALVLDKALLELLNMEEGSIVKIKTDGVSLIITPQMAVVQDTISPTITIEGTLNDAIKNTLTQSLGDAEKTKEYQAELKEITERYAAISKGKLDKPEVRQLIASIQKKFSNDESNPEYAKQVKAIHYQYAPELKAMDRELSTFGKKYAAIGSPKVDTSQMEQMTAEFTKVHEKYRHLMQAVSDLNENASYLQEMVLLAEKYQANNESTNSQEYFAEYAGVISKYIPEYAAYQEELKKVVEPFSTPVKEAKAAGRNLGRKKR